MNKKYSAFVFILVLSGISFLYNYQDIFFKRPQSVHKWRQADCASIALNYYQDGLNFFRPETHNLTSDHGTTGKCCTSEVPVLYYAVASLYRVFGYHDFIYRIFNTLLFFLGLFFLYKLFHFLLQDVFWAIALSLLFFTSPVLVYYANNYLSNSPALAFSFIGWYFFFRFVSGGEKKWFIISMLVFLIASAFKVTALISVFAISGIYISDIMGIVNFNVKGKLFTRPARFLPFLVPVFLIIAAWLLYAHHYNQEHHCSYFSTTIFPIWDLDRAGIINVLDSIRKIWMDQYFHISVFFFLLICLIFIAFYFKRVNKIIAVGLVIIFIETIIYVLLQFWTLKDHDYYIIDIYILPVLIVAGAFEALKKHFQKLFASPYLKIAFSLFLLFTIFYARQQLNLRYNGWMNESPGKNDMHSITPYLRQVGVLQTDTVISIPDGSHVSLYLMNQKGWTEYADAGFNRKTPVLYNRDSAGIQSSIDKGAKFLILNGIEQLYYKPYLQNFCTHLAGQYENVLIFKLESGLTNFKPEERTIDTIYYCDAEFLSSDGRWYLAESDSNLFQAAGNQSDEFSHSGNMSCKLDANTPYGMTCRLYGLKEGESFEISVWRKPGINAKGSLIASGSPNPFYSNDFKIMETDSAGWERIGKEIFITSELENQEIAFYLFNQEQEAVYFDDFKITRYKSVIPE